MSSPSIPTENKMGTMPIGRLILSMSLPMMVSMLIQALYNIVDSVFVSMISEEALTAVSLAFPLQNVMISIGVGTGVGINALLSKRLGEKNFAAANSIAMHGIITAFFGYALFLLIGFFGIEAFMRSQTDHPEIIAYGVQYLRICCIFSFGVFFQIVFERLLQSTGRTMFTMFAQAAGAITNIILDPILIFGAFGLPAMGVTGAAIATVIGQLVGCSLGLFFNLRKNPDIQLSLKGFKPKASVFKGIYAVGVPSIVMGSIGSVMVFGLNKIIIPFSTTAATVLGVYYKLQSFIFMPVFGLNNGMVPIIAYNYGARRKDRVARTISLSVLFAMAIMLAGLVCFQLFPAQLLGIFNPSPALLEIGVPALRIISLSYLFAGFCIVTSSVFQALGKGLYSMFISIVRQLVMLLPAAFILSRLGGLSAVWWAFPIAELSSLTLCIIFLRIVYKNVLSKMSTPPAPLTQSDELEDNPL